MDTLYITVADLRKFIEGQPDERGVDFWVSEARQGGVAGRATFSGELGINLAVNIVLPDGYHLTIT
jgi:hypothetical protein